jgi:hypothetical protein
VCFVVHKTISKLEHVILTTLYFAGVENTDSWCVWKGDLQRAFSLDVPMVCSSVITIAVDDECLMCGGFPLGETIPLGSFEFIINYFGGLSLSPGGATQVLPSWAQLDVGLHPRGEP